MIATVGLLVLCAGLLVLVSYLLTPPEFRPGYVEVEPPARDLDENVCPVVKMDEAAKRWDNVHGMWVRVP